MQFTDADAETPVIRDLTHQLDEDRCTLRWRWPDGIQAVYIHRTAVDTAGEEIGARGVAAEELPSARNLRLYTRNEYKANNGYHDRIESVGRIAYTIYVNLTEDGEPILIRQPDLMNRKEFSTGKARITYEIRHKGGLLSKYKTVQMKVKAEIPVPKEVLCYVKKQGGYPANKDDGTMYPFLSDFVAGQNVLPSIEVGKQDYVRLFFTDGKRYGSLYELVQMK
ncbi:hypothetical protein [Paenibacillus pini]|uniref:Beta-mannanase n=1 Tax=Paenibacillus pini JCM 16418 TaxID=1236976 RepID=W7YMX4_9BACL|nr:hypothetical protein [Paenibacillus pini]GAF09807.1 hypothetical protein JCM16418_3963 [Paenibacillus pini JCM 16418]